METSMSVHWTTIRSLIEERLWSPTILYHPSRFSFNVTFFNDWSFHRRERVETGECWWKTLLNHRSGSGLGGRRSTMPLEGVSPYSSSITCWYRIPVTAYTGWHGQNLLGLLDNGETRLRERRSMCYIARSLLYGSFYPLSLRPSLSRPPSKWETKRHVHAYRRFDECHCVGRYRTLFCIIFFSPLLFLFSGGRWLDQIFSSTFGPFRGVREIGFEWLERDIYMCICICITMISFWRNFDLEIWVFFFWFFVWIFVGVCFGLLIREWFLFIGLNRLFLSWKVFLSFFILTFGISFISTNDFGWYLV